VIFLGEQGDQQGRGQQAFQRVRALKVVVMFDAGCPFQPTVIETVSNFYVISIDRL